MMQDEMQEILNDFLAESSEMLESLDQNFVKLEADPSNTELLNEIFRCMHSMKGSAGFLGFTRLVEVAHQAESLLNKLRQGEMAASPFVIDIILEAVDIVRSLQADIRETGEDSHVDTEMIVHKLTLTLESAADLSPAPSMGSGKVDEKPSLDRSKDSGSVSQSGSSITQVVKDHPGFPVTTQDEGMKEGSQARENGTGQCDMKPGLSEMLTKMQEMASRTLQAASPGSNKSSTSREEDHTVRIETRRLDHVMNLVGELVLSRNRLMKLGIGIQEQCESNHLVRELATTLAQLNLVTSDLQLAVMKTRMVPIRKVFSRFPRLVRDVGGKLGKQVRLELTGEETEVDKSVADELSDPLVHLVRNAMDHGLETPDERTLKGKNPEGCVRLAASQEGNSIVIRVMDDGRGLQVDKIASHAVAKGMVTEADLSTMSTKDMMNLIFLPGFSTADQVSDLSGRGVGMDVVRTNITRMNGSLELDSEVGRGSRVTIKLPLTVAIIQALMVEVERATFAIPLACVIEAVKTTKDEIKSVNGQAVLNLRERILPLLDLGQMFQLPQDHETEECYIVVVAVGERRVGVIVDRLRAQEEVVIKSLGEFLSEVKGVGGATITGDGKVVLILDLANLVAETKPPLLVRKG